MLKRVCILFGLSIVLINCNSGENQVGNDRELNDQISGTEESISEAEAIIEKCIAVHGGSKYDDSTVSFEFRKRKYKSSRKGGVFTYERLTNDTEKGEIHDILTNSALTRKINGQTVELVSKDSAAYARSVNSVIYFALLPYFLYDPAVKSTYLGEINLKGEPYHKVKVTFQQEGGGRDFEDVYIYWIHRDNYTMDYLAYNYVVDGGGARFRKSYNNRIINGLRFSDYINYKPEPETREVEIFDRLFEEGKLKELSRIESENVVVE